MPRSPRRPTTLAGKIFRADAAISEGLLTPADLRSSAWRPLFRGIYADATLTITHLHRCLAVAGYVLPPSGAIGGRSAAYLYGARLIAERDPVEVLVPRTARIRVSGIRTHVAELDADEIRVVNGMPVTTPVRTCWDLAQWSADPVETVVVVDALAARGAVRIPDLTEYAWAHAGRRGWRRLLDAARLADPGAESPPETRLRVRLVRAGIPRPVTQFVVTRNGRFVARSDLAWPEFRVAVEYDGVWHAESATQIHADRRRLNDLMAAGWIVLHVTAKRLRDDFDGFVRELRAVLRSRGAR